MSGNGADFQVISWLDEPAVEVGEEPLRWVPIRRTLGIEGFGVNAWRGGEGDQIIEDHVESPGQEELYVVFRGRVEFTIGGEGRQLDTGQAVFVRDPELRRGAVALEPESVVLAIGGWPDQPYHSLPWEAIYLSDGPMRRGDWSETIEVLEREAGPHRENPFVRYRMACCLAQLGDGDAALGELQAAIEQRPQMRERAEADELLRPLHGLGGWPPAAAP